MNSHSYSRGERYDTTDAYAYFVYIVWHDVQHPFEVTAKQKAAVDLTDQHNIIV